MDDQGYTDRSIARISYYIGSDDVISSSPVTGFGRGHVNCSAPYESTSLITNLSCMEDKTSAMTGEHKVSVVAHETSLRHSYSHHLRGLGARGDIPFGQAFHRLQLAAGDAQASSFTLRQDLPHEVIPYQPISVYGLHRALRVDWRMIPRIY